MRTRRARVGQVIGLVVAASTVVGCKADVEAGTRTGISERKLEQTLQERITDEIGTAPDSIDCPGGLDGEKGATQVCVLTAGTDELDVTATVSSVKGKTVNFELEIGEVKSAS